MYKNKKYKLNVLLIVLIQDCGGNNIVEIILI